MLVYKNDHEQSTVNDRIWKWHGNLIIDSRRVKYLKKFYIFLRVYCYFRGPQKKLGFSYTELAALIEGFYN
jgi:hypothetical protein